LCPTQSFRTCADVSIIPSTTAAAAAYVPNPVKPITTSYPTVFMCKGVGIEYNQTLDVQTFPNKRVDTLKYTGDGLFCLYYPNDTTVSCKLCQSQCMTSGQVCPSNCYCRWFSRKPNIYTTPINWADPTNY
jgi:hypothetical protein